MMMLRLGPGEIPTVAQPSYDEFRVGSDGGSTNSNEVPIKF
jgi:hypothetical protein